MKRSREKFHDEKASVAHDSHTPYTHLQREQLVERLRNCQKEKRSLKSKCTYRSSHLKNLIKKQGMRMADGDNDDFNRLIEELSPQVENEFEATPPIHVLEITGEVQQSKTK